MKYDTILLKSSDRIISLLMPELQKGFYVPSREGKTVYSFLTGTCGISDTYISQKIKTVLVNGGPVDDIFNTVIRDGGVCAVSGAMPGIVGAMMRIGSPYAVMRESITVKPDRSVESGNEIIITLKLFNVILSDMGPVFLKRGILLDRGRVSDFFTKHGDVIFSCCSEILLNDYPVDKQKITGPGNEAISGLVILKTEVEDENNS